jgi:5'-methylthioadenosine phosphorylase
MPPVSSWVLGVLGGSGLYEIDGLEDRRWVEVSSPWGAPSDAILHGRLGAVELRFLPRHGRGHRLSPTDLNFRANIDALKRAGCTDVLSLSAVGSLREALRPGDFVVVDQFIDRTFARAKSFFGAGMVAHVSMADPVCPRCPPSPPPPRARPGRAWSRAEPTSPWRARSSPPAPKASSTGPGAAT